MCWNILARKAPLPEKAQPAPPFSCRQARLPSQRGRSPPLPFPADIFNAFCGGSGGSLTNCDWISVASHWTSGTGQTEGEKTPLPEMVALFPALFLQAGKALLPDQAAHLSFARFMKAAIGDVDQLGKARPAIIWIPRHVQRSTTRTA